MEAEDDAERDATPSDRPFRIGERDGRRLVWLDGDRIDACFAHARESGVEWIGLDHGFEPADLSFLRAAPAPLRLSLTKPDDLELQALAGLLSLVEIHSGSNCQREFDLRGCENLESVDLGWCPRLTLPDRTNAPLRLRFNRYPPNTRDLSKLAAPPSLAELALERANLRSLNGVERFTSLRKLRVQANGTLADVSALARVPTLEHLEFEGVVELSDLSALAQLPRLRTLRLHDAASADLAAQLTPLAQLESLTLKSCIELPNLRFLASLPQLRELRLIDTNILDGDLRPLLPLPIVAVHPNRKHYIPSVLKLDVLRATADRGSSAAARPPTT